MKKKYRLHYLHANTHMETFKTGDKHLGVLFDLSPNTKRVKIGFVTDDARVARQLALCFQEMATELDKIHDIPDDVA